jgi:hypothetical protein
MSTLLSLAEEREGKKHVGKYRSWDNEKAVFLPSIHTGPSSITSPYHMSL